MDYKIVADSCCDLTPEWREELGAISVPLTLHLGDNYYTDNDELDVGQFVSEMNKCKGKIGSAAPSPALYRDAFSQPGADFAVTLSSCLSASYANALIGKDLAAEARPADVHVFDSKSASAGEILIVLRIRKLINEGLIKSKIITAVESFIKEMKLFFVLDNPDNLVKNGRMSKVTGKLISVLNISPILGSDGEGNIALFSHARGQKQVVEKLADTIEKSGKNTEGEKMVITHCNNPGLAEKLKQAIVSRYKFAEVLVFQTRGLSSVYVSDKGVIMAF